MESVTGKVLLDITPVWVEGTIKEAKIQLVMEGCTFGQGEKLLAFTEEIYGIPSNVLWESICLEDDNGKLGFERQEERHQHRKEKWMIVQKETKGSISLSYETKFNPARPNPVMDMGYEPNGVTGTGYSWLPVLPDGKYEVHMQFHKEEVPKDCRLLCGYGEDEILMKLDSTGLLDVFYCFGIVKAVEEENFGYYWMDRDGFDATEVAAWTKNLFLKMAEFFRDTKETYKIFARARSCHGSGGVAATRSYTYIYDPDNLPDFSALKFLFAHEMVHNWAHMQDKPYGTCTWYVEGMADYYSMVLPWRFGMVTREELIKQLQSCVDQYYENPCRMMQNRELGDLLFHDLEATTVPYGRGLFYLMQVDQRIREKTGGKKNLDAVFQVLRGLDLKGEKLQNGAWLRTVWEETGLDETEQLLLLAQGELILPELSCFEQASLQAVEREAVLRRSGEACVSYTVR